MIKTKATVNVRRYNKQVLQRKLRAASYVSAPKLVKGFHNNSRLIEVPCKSDPSK